MARTGERRWPVACALGALLLGVLAPLAAAQAPNGGPAQGYPLPAETPAPLVWRGEYYANATLEGLPALVRQEAAVDFAWEGGAPADGLPADRFSARYSALAWFDAGDYTFSLTADDGARLWVDDALLLDHWEAQPVGTHEAALTLAAGYHSLRLEYWEASDTALCRLDWRPTPQGAPAPTAAPTLQVQAGPREVVVDESDPGFTWGGETAGREARPEGHGGGLLWTWNAEDTERAWGRWQAALPEAGDWEVEVYVAARYHTAAAATYVIQHAGQRDEHTVDQRAQAGRWVSLGTYEFRAAGEEYVQLSDATGAPYATEMVGYDAVRFRRAGLAAAAETPGAPGCAYTPTLRFGALWEGVDGLKVRLGCATAPERQTLAGEQAFQGGTMYRRLDTGAVYVLYADGSWQEFAGAWEAVDGALATDETPPPGYDRPRGALGRVWAEHAGVRARLGWATAAERPFQGAAQAFEGGVLLWSNARGVLALYTDRTWALYPLE